MSKDTSKDIKKTESKETTQNKPEKRKILRRAELEQQGRLYVDESHKEPGYVYRIVNDKPGRIKWLERLGYEVVEDKTQVGTESANTTHQLGSAVTVETSIYGKSQTGVLMKCPKDIYDERQREKAQDNQAAFDQSVSDNQYKGQKTD